MIATRGVAALVALALVAGTTGACSAQKNSKKPGVTLSGPGPEILVGGLLVVGGASLATNVGSKDDQFNAQQTLFLVGVGVAVLGVVLIGHGVYRLTRPAPASQPPGPPMPPPS